MNTQGPQELTRIEHPDTPPVTPPEQAAPWGYCYICRQPIRTAFYHVPLVSAGRRGFWWGRAHCRCYDARPEVTA